MTALSTTDFRQTFRDGAATLLHRVADMSLHELVDEYVRLTAVVKAGTLPPADGEFGSARLTDEANIAARERQVVNGAAKSRFGISFDPYDDGNF